MFVIVEDEDRMFTQSLRAPYTVCTTPMVLLARPAIEDTPMFINAMAFAEAEFEFLIVVTPVL